MKRWIVFLCLCLLLSLLTGCGAPVPDTETTAQVSDTEAAPESPVTPLLFHVEDGKGGEMYLFGTIHVGDARIGEALERVRPYLDRCGALAVEFDILAFEKDRLAQMQAMTQFVYTDGSKVSAHMPKELFEQASALLNRAGLFPTLMENYNLAMWALLVEQAAMMTSCDLDFDGGMDRKLIQYCYDREIPVQDVESPELQYSLMASFSDELNLLLIENVLSGLDSYGEGITGLYEAWTRGSYAELLSVVTSQEEDEEADLTQEQQALLEDYNDRMLNARNLGMRDAALSCLQADKPVFFAVGTAHLLGEAGLVELLRAQGCTVEQITYDP